MIFGKGWRDGAWGKTRLLGMAFAAAFLGAAPALGADIVAGPMIGHVTARSARIWMQLSVAKRVTVTCFDAETNRGVSQVALDVHGPLPFIADLPLNNLLPNRSYRIEVKLDGAAVALPGPAVAIRTMPEAGAEAAFTVAFGSCMDPGGADGAPTRGAIFKAVQAVHPRAFFFLGNSGYLPARLDGFPQTHREAFRFLANFYSRVRRAPELRDLFATTACYGIWGDHDFGPDHADKTFVFAKESLAAFQRFYPNPDWGTPKIPGCFFKATIGDADFFCLDGRTYRDPPPAPGNGDTARSLFGADQIGWLEKGLKESNAAFKIIAAAEPLIGEGREGAPASDGSWAAFQPEQKNFLEWLAAEHVGGVIFIAGGGPDATPGQVFGALSALKRTVAGAPAYPLLQLTSAPLNVAAAAGEGIPADDERLGAPVAAANFGTLEFGGQGDNRFVTLRLRDGDGKIRAEQTIFAGQLKK